MIGTNISAMEKEEKVYRVENLELGNLQCDLVP